MTDFWIVSALAPGYEARTITVGACAVAYHGNVVDLLEYLIEKNVHIDLLSDQTSCHVPYDGGYCPQGLTFEQRTEMLDKDPEGFAKLVDPILLRSDWSIMNLLS